VGARGKGKKNTRKKNAQHERNGEHHTQHVNKNGVLRDTMDEYGKKMMMTG
jgi:hypothetical protein